MRRPVTVLVGIAVALLLGLAYTGIAGGIEQFDQTTHSQFTLGQIVQTTLQLAFGLLSLASVAVRFWATGWSRPVLIAWALTLSLAGGLASVVWGRSSILVGVVSGLASALVAVGIAALLRVGLPKERPARQAGAPDS